MRFLPASTLLLTLLIVPPAMAQSADAFTKRLHRIALQLGVPGFSAAIVRDGKIIYRHEEGVADLATGKPVTASSLFGIASVTKSMTAIILTQLESEGKIRLSDPLLAYPLNTGWHPPDSIGDPNNTIGDVLSMSAGGRPGETYFYNGARFNLLSGLFDKVSGMGSPQSYVIQNRERILRPLGMNDTMAGFQKANPLAGRAVSRYEAAPSNKGWNYVERPYDWDAAYPASGIISTVDDLAKYAAALDHDALIDRISYERLTASRNGHPYGYGWFTQRVSGIRLHWVFGYGQAESALFLRVPDMKLTFIFLSNADTPSALAQLDYANVLRQPFGLAFFDTWVKREKPIDFDRPMDDIVRAFGAHPSDMQVEALMDEALLQAFKARMTGAGQDKAVALTELLLKVAPERFAQPDPYMLRLMSDVTSKQLEVPTRQLLRSFDYSADHRPVIANWGGRVLEKLGDIAGAAKLYAILCDRDGFDDEPMKGEACERLGSHEAGTGQIASGRRHIWHSALISRHMNDDKEFKRKLAMISNLAAPGP